MVSLPDGDILAVPAEEQLNLFSLASGSDVVDIPVRPAYTWVESNSLRPTNLKFRKKVIFEKCWR